jgi:hypothetical protein
MHRILIYGGRDFRDGLRLALCLATLRTTLGDFVVINGGARGADTLAKEWGLAQGLPTITMDAPWTALGKRAGFVRNQWMLDHAAPTYAVEFPGGPGTADMRSRVERAGLTLWRPLSN